MVNSKPPTIPFRIIVCTFQDNLSQNGCITVNIDDITSGTEDSQSHMQLKCVCVKKVSMELVSNTNFSLLVHSI